MQILVHSTNKKKKKKKKERVFSQNCTFLQIWVKNNKNPKSANFLLFCSIFGVCIRKKLKLKNNQENKITREDEDEITRKSIVCLLFNCFCWIIHYFCFCYYFFFLFVYFSFILCFFYFFFGYLLFFR